MSIGGSSIPSGCILAGSPSRVVYEIPKEGYIVLKGRVTLRDYEITQCVVKILGGWSILNASVTRPSRFVIDLRYVEGVMALGYGPSAAPELRAFLKAGRAATSGKSTLMAERRQLGK